MFGLPVKIDLRDFFHLNKSPIHCQEAAPISSERYVACGNVTKKLVLSERGTRLYFMCDGCADHNVRNRGAILVAVHEEMKV
jgi:hypothetical protein